jgi:hypothetical protein
VDGTIQAGRCAGVGFASKESFGQEYSQFQARNVSQRGGLLAKLSTHWSQQPSILLPRSLAKTICVAWGHDPPGDNGLLPHQGEARTRGREQDGLVETAGWRRRDGMSALT